MSFNVKGSGKLDKLLEYLSGLDKVVVAFSGGVDSTLLLKTCEMALGKNVTAIMVMSPYMPKWELEEAKEILKEFQVNYKIIEVPLLDEVKMSPKDRCYVCKKFIFNMIKEEAEKLGVKYVLDGTNFDDTKDYRPGMKALMELEIKSPLKEWGFTKKEIREASKELGLKTWDKPAYACLLSRIPYGQEVFIEDLRLIEEAEVFLMDMGFKGARIRKHDNIARIEIQGNQMEKVLSLEIFHIISEKLKSLGFTYVTLDMSGYKMGSLNEGNMEV